MTQRELEKRLRSLRHDDGGWESWPELVERAGRPHRGRRRLLIAAIAVAILAVPTIAVAVRLVDVIVVSAESEQIPAAEELILPYVAADSARVSGVTKKLVQPLWAPLLGEDAALAVPSPDGRFLAYHAWAARGEEAGTPLIRLLDLQSGRDTVLKAGAQSLAWRADGTVAMTEALKAEYENSPQGTLGGHFGHVAVRRSPAAAPVRWTTLPTDYVVRAWAGSTLLVNVHPSLVAHGRQPDRGLHALDGPRQLRRLPLDDLVALNPDGTLAAGPPSTTGDSPPAPFLDVARVADGRRVARLALPRELLSITGIGSWLSDRIVARATYRRGTGALLVIRVAGRELAIERTIRLDRQPALSAGVPGFRGVSFGQPTLAGQDARYVIVRAVVLGEGDRVATMFVTCDRTGPVCRKGRSLEPRRWAALVVNPSRPLPSPPSSSG